MRTQTASLVILLTASVPGLAIIGGNFLEDSILPQVGYLRSDISPHLCSAVLVGPNVIATAAHCAAASKQSFVMIDGREIRVTKFHKDPGYTGNIVNAPEDFAVKHDLAIGVLAESADIAPISISARKPSIGETLVVAGTGMPDRTVRQYGQLKVVTVSPIGVTLRGSGANPQVGAKGDSGGGTFHVTSDGITVLVAINSTSTETRNLTSQFNWPEALPYTMGSERLLPEASGETFVEAIARRQGLSICGVTENCADVIVP